MPSGSGTSSLPFGPSTFIVFPRAIFTPFGSGMGLFPTLDIIPSLPKLAENLPAHMFFASRTARHHPARRGQDADSQPAQHFRDFPAAHINTAARPRNPLDARDHRHVARRVLQINADAFL